MMSAQLISIVTMFISGIAVGAVIDCTRILLWQIPLKWVHQLKSVIEWIIWLFLGICTFYLLFLIKGGQWRVVDPLAQISGIIAYEFVFQRMIRFVGRVILNIAIKPIYYVVHLIIRIIGTLIKWVIAGIVLLLRPFTKLFKKYLLKTF